MRIEINGKPRELREAATIGALVDEHISDRRGVAVALDGDVVPRRIWDETPVTDGARVEIVAAVQGG